MDIRHELKVVLEMVGSIGNDEKYQEKMLNHIMRLIEKHEDEVVKKVIGSTKLGNDCLELLDLR